MRLERYALAVDLRGLGFSFVEVGKRLPTHEGFVRSESGTSRLLKKALTALFPDEEERAVKARELRVGRTREESHDDARMLAEVNRKNQVSRVW